MESTTEFINCLLFVLVAFLSPFASNPLRRDFLIGLPMIYD